MSRKGDCRDNAVAKSFFATLKKELIHRDQFKTRRQAAAAIFEYIEVFYNRIRLHSILGYKTTPCQPTPIQSLYWDNIYLGYCRVFQSSAMAEL